MGALDIAGFQEAAPRGMLCDEEGDVSTLMLMKTNGAYTESFGINPESLALVSPHLCLRHPRFCFRKKARGCRQVQVTKSTTLTTQS